MVGAGDVPLLAADAIPAGTALRARLDLNIRARAALGDRVALLARATLEGQHVTVELFLAAGLEHPAMRLGEAPAERIGDPAQLLPDRDLVEHPRITTAMGRRHIHRAEPEFDCELAVPRLHLGRHLALVELGFDLPGNELLVRELRRAIAPRRSCFIEPYLHDGYLAPTAMTRPAGAARSAATCCPAAGRGKCLGNASARYDMLIRRARSRLMDSGRTSRSSHRPSVSAERPSATTAGSTSG